MSDYELNQLCIEIYGSEEAFIQATFNDLENAGI